MGYTNPQYPDCLVALLNYSRRVEKIGLGHYDEGDIICSRRLANKTHIGLAEHKEFLWVPICGMEENVMTSLHQPDAPPEQVVTRTLPDGTMEDTLVIPRSDRPRRYRITFQRLKQIDPMFDMNAARDLGISYQPYVFACQGNKTWYEGSATTTLGQVRVPLKNIELNHDSNAEYCSPRLTILSAPPNFTISIPWLEAKKSNYDALRAKFGSISKARQWVKSEEEKMRTEGIIVEARDGSGKLASGVTFQYRIEGWERGCGRISYVAPPFDCHGLIYDKQTMRYL